MVDEQPRAPAGASAATSSEAARDTLPFPLWLLFGLGALSCATWLEAVQLDVWTASIHAPYWLRYAPHAALVLDVPTLIFLFGRSSRMPARRHPQAFLLVATLLALIVALPALLPLTAPGDLASLPVASLALRVPTLSLGVTLAAVDPLVIERWRRSDSHDSPAAIAAGVGFGVAAVIAVFIALIANKPECGGETGLGCGALVGRMMLPGFGGGFLLALPGLFGALLGYRIGAWVARADYW